MRNFLVPAISPLEFLKTIKTLFGGKPESFSGVFPLKPGCFVGQRKGVLGSQTFKSDKLMVIENESHRRSLEISKQIFDR